MYHLTQALSDTMHIAFGTVVIHCELNNKSFLFFLSGKVKIGAIIHFVSWYIILKLGIIVVNIYCPLSTVCRKSWSPGDNFVIGIIIVQSIVNCPITTQMLSHIVQSQVGFSLKFSSAKKQTVSGDVSGGCDPSLVYYYLPIVFYCTNT